MLLFSDYAVDFNLIHMLYSHQTGWTALVVEFLYLVSTKYVVVFKFPWIIFMKLFDNMVKVSIVKLCRESMISLLIQ